MTNEEIRGKYFEVARGAWEKRDFAFLEPFSLGPTEQSVLQETIGKAVSDDTFPMIEKLSIFLGKKNAHLTHLKHKGLMKRGAKKDVWILSSLVFAKFDKNGQSGEQSQNCSGAVEVLSEDSVKVCVLAKMTNNRIVMSPETQTAIASELGTTVKDLRQVIDQIVSDGYFRKNKRSAGMKGFILIIKDLQKSEEGEREFEKPEQLSNASVPADSKDSSYREQLIALIGREFEQKTAKMGDDIATFRAQIEHNHSEVARLESENVRLEAVISRLESSRDKKIKSKDSLLLTIQEVLSED